jgi:hypothetical protein
MDEKGSFAFLKNTVNFRSMCNAGFDQCKKVALIGPNPFDVCIFVLLALVRLFFQKEHGSSSPLKRIGANIVRPRNSMEAEKRRRCSSGSLKSVQSICVASSGRCLENTRNCSPGRSSQSEVFLVLLSVTSACFVTFQSVTRCLDS